MPRRWIKRDAACIPAVGDTVQYSRPVVCPARVERVDGLLVDLSMEIQGGFGGPRRVYRYGVEHSAEKKASGCWRWISERALDPEVDDDPAR